MAGQWAKLVAEDQVGRVTRGFMDAIEASFEEGHVHVLATKSEIRHRFDICAKLFERLRGDEKWSIARTLDMLPRYLRCELEGQSYDPKADADRVMWTPETGDPLR